MLQELLEAKFAVTALTRPSSTSTFPPSVKVAKVDYDNIDSLTSALQGHDALISTLGSAGIKQQVNLIDAAINAGVQRLIPSEFGCDLSNPLARKLPVYAPKLQVEQAIEEKCKGTQMTYTYVFNGAFLDWGADVGLLMDLKGKKMELIDGGDRPFTVSPLPFVAKGVVAVLGRPEETANKGVRLHGASMTQKRLLDLAQRFAGKDGWQITEVESANLEKQSYENLKKDPSNAPSWIFGFLKRAIYGEHYGNDFSKNNDDEMLGLKPLSEEEIDELVRIRAI